MSRETYIQETFVGSDSLLEEVLETIKKENMPSISVSPESGKLLTMLVRMSGAKRILEVGALGGYSGICLLRGAGNDGRLTSLELRQEYADVAKQHLQKAGFGEQVTYHIGEALDSFNAIVQDGMTFDFIFIDADKRNYGNYLDYALQVATPGAIIAGDNTLRRDRIWDEEDQHPDTLAIRAFNQKMAEHPRLESLLIPIGDGITVGQVRE